MDNKLRVFMIMPFDEDYLALFEKLKEIFKDKYDFTNAGDLDSQQNIIRDIVEGIFQADVIIADLTGLNANVFYELGIAHTMNKKVIIITQDIDELPFDIKSYRANQYNMKFNRIPQLLKKLEELLQGAQDGNINFGNPINDFVPSFFECKNLEKEKRPIEKKDNYGVVSKTGIDNGYLDYITEINDKASKIGDEITALNDEMQKMNEDITDAIEDINSKNNSNIKNNINVNYAKMICRKLAEPIDTFAKKMNVHTKEILKYWSIVENNFLSLLDNKYAKQKNNIEDIKNSIFELKTLQSELKKSDGVINNLISISRGSMGIERKLNSAISRLIYEFEKYLSMTNTMYSSIDRISIKSELLIEESSC